MSVIASFRSPTPAQSSTCVADPADGGRAGPYTTTGYHQLTFQSGDRVVGKPDGNILVRCAPRHPPGAICRGAGRGPIEGAGAVYARSTPHAAANSCPGCQSCLRCACGGSRGRSVGDPTTAGIVTALDGGTAYALFLGKSSRLSGSWRMCRCPKRSTAASLGRCSYPVRPTRRCPACSRSSTASWRGRASSVGGRGSCHARSNGLPRIVRRRGAHSALLALAAHTLAGDGI